MPIFQIVLDFAADVEDEEQMEGCKEAIYDGAISCNGSASIISIEELYV